MKTILIIEDDENIVRKMTLALEGLGAIACCTMADQGFKPMPSLEQVEKMITEADIILLDGDLGSRTPYGGQDLFLLCHGKKVIGISTNLSFSFGKINYRRKNNLTFSDSIENQKFRTLVLDQLQ